MPTFDNPARQPSLFIPHGGGPCFFMKWTIDQKEFDALSPDEQKHFSVQKTSSGKSVITEASLKKKGFALWTKHTKVKFPKAMSLSSINRVKRKYEIFCGGFLWFYDRTLLRYLNEVNKKTNNAGNNFLQYFQVKKQSKNQFNHTMAFIWEQNADGWTVKIYLNPPAGNPDPPSTPKPPPPENSFA